MTLWLPTSRRRSTSRGSIVVGGCSHPEATGNGRRVKTTITNGIQVHRLDRHTGANEGRMAVEQQRSAFDAGASTASRSAVTTARWSGSRFAGLQRASLPPPWASPERTSVTQWWLRSNMALAGSTVYGHPSRLSDNGNCYIAGETRGFAKLRIGRPLVAKTLASRLTSKGNTMTRDV